MKLEEIKNRYIHRASSFEFKDHATSDVEWLIRRVEKLEKALKFYADSSGYEPVGDPYSGYGADKEDMDGEVIQDGGHIARKAIAEDE